MKKLIVNQKIIVSIILILVSFCFITETTYSEVTISEIMYGSEPTFTPHQWIEISNASSKPINMAGWKLIIQNADAENLDGPLNATIVFEDEFWGDAPTLWNNETLLVATDEDSNNTSDVMEDQVFALRWRGGLDISFHQTFLSGNGFRIQLIDKTGNVVDQAGNYDGNAILWNLPYDYNRGRTRAGNRTSLLRLYDNGVALDGTLESSWVSAADANLSEDQLTYYGDENDISSPGILGPDTVIQKTPDPEAEKPQQQTIQVTISEIMYGSEARFTPVQWIEIINTGSETIDMTGWKLTVQNADATNLDGPLNATIVFEDEFHGEAPRIYPNDFLLIVVDEGANDDAWKFGEDQVFALRWRGGLDISFYETFLSGSGFLIQLIDKDGNVVDQAGNYDGSKTLWDLPYGFNRGRTREGNRTSLIRRYNNGVALDGTLESSWVAAADANLSEDQLAYYGDENDISSAGIGPIDFTTTNQQPEEPTEKQPEEPTEKQPEEPAEKQPEEPAGNQQPEGIPEDVNGDGDVNIHDLVLVASNLGKSGQNASDVNGDNIVNIQDLVLVAGAFGKTAP